ncbi:nicotinamidase-related amidase [Paenibacillus sp. V4I3]|uniref:isochorismatase family protein n=1 Tax=Paenibacillus sp. V4I3 TaxID=3042305 RepID=UPI002782332C|nr:isochorismatase family protein [Paenibacillus sp. V4I3]MDQ0876114.1 nicotinamidase-related amidase [Paenibacillus sp. V4I3]
MNHMKKLMATALVLTIGVGIVLGSSAVSTVNAKSNDNKANTQNQQQLALIDPNDTALLLVDPQSGLLQTVKDLDVPTVRGNVRALAKMAELANIPVITTASVPDGPNGPLIPEVKDLPNATFVPRHGEINAWDDPDFVKAVEATGKKTLIIAGTWSSVCMTFPTLSALKAGYKVYSVIDASGTYSKMSSDITLTRIVQAGAVPVDTVSLVAEVQRTWNRSDAGKFAAIYAERVPNYGLLIESYQEAYGAGQKAVTK